VSVQTADVFDGGADEVRTKKAPPTRATPMAAPGAARERGHDQVSGMALAAGEAIPARPRGNSTTLAQNVWGSPHQVGQREWHSDHRHAASMRAGRRRPSASRAAKSASAARGTR